MIFQKKQQGCTFSVWLCCFDSGDPGLLFVDAVVGSLLEKLGKMDE